LLLIPSKKEVKLEEVKTLVSDWGTVHEVRKSEDFRDPDVKVSELVEAIQTSSPNETPLEKASKVGVTSKLKAMGVDLNPENKSALKLTQQLGFSPYDNEMFAASLAAEDKKIFDVASLQDSSKRDIVEVLHEQIVLKGDAVGEAEV